MGPLDKSANFLPQRTLQSKNHPQPQKAVRSIRLRRQGTIKNRNNDE